MTARMLCLALSGTALVALAAPASAAAYTVSQRAEWTGTAPRVASHGEVLRSVCFAGGFYRAEGNSYVVADPEGCPDIDAPIPSTAAEWSP